MFNPNASFTPSSQKQMNKSAPKSGQKWTVVGDLNQFLAHSNGFSGEDYAHQPQQHTGSPSAQLNQLDSSHYREAGIIEKLLPSYGFIQCCERQARLFFHYSQFNGKIEHLHVGDAVEFEMTYDKRTGKPIASFVVKISSEAIGEESAVERVTGFITIELNADKEGRVAYENRGECFFLPFGRDDLDDPNTELRSKDRVTFLITKDKNGTPRARHVALETPSPQRFRGVVCTIKDSFGFIERADQVREIFFHSSECAQFKQLQENDSVEFSIQVRNNKEVATSVDLLERGTSQFEKFVEEGCIGQVLEPIDRSKLHPQLLNAYNSYSLLKSNGYEPFPGKILYRQNGEEIEIPLGYREVKYTLQIGDWVRFKIVLDTRDQQRYAADVTFLEETLKYSGEKRIQGQLMNLVGDKGFIQDANGTLYMFHHHEIINPKAPFEHRQMVEFTPAVDSTETSISNGNGGGGSAGMPPMAIRVIAGCQSNNDLVGAQSSSPSHHAMKGCVSELSDASRTGRIRLFEQVNGCPEQVTFSFSDVVSDSSLFINDRVDLKLEQVEPNTWKPSEIRIIKSQVSRLGTSDSASGIDLPAPHYMPHSGSIRALSRFKGILHSNLLANKDIFFNVINLPAGLFSIESVFDFHVDFDHEANVLRAYDIRISTDSPDTAFDPNLDTFKSPKSDWGAAERFGQKLSGKIEYLSRDGGILVRGHHRYQFQMSEFPLLMVDLNNEFEFVVSLQTGLQNLWQAVELNPIASSSDTNQSTALRRQKGFVVKLNKFGGLLQANRNRYPFSFQSFLDTPIGITYNDEIEFSLEQRNGRTTAIDLEPIASKAGAKDDAKANGKRSDLDYSFENAKGKTANRSVQRGFVAAIKESYGFIESEHYDQEVFFHFSIFEGNLDDLRPMTEVEFIAQYRPGKTAAEFVRPLPAGSIQYTIQPDTLTGYVGRTIRCLNPEQNEYCGFIYETADISHNANQKPDLTYSAKYPFTMISLAKANEYVYEDDPVTFQLSVLSDGKKVAVNVNPVREKYTADVIKIKDTYGYLNYQPKDSKSFAKKQIQFHLSDVRDKASTVSVGDIVEFEVVRKKDRFVAVSILKIRDGSQKPDHLIQIGKLQINDDFKSVLTRQPKGPDGGKGFVRNQTSDEYLLE